MPGSMAVSIGRMPLPAGDADGWAARVAYLLEVALAEIDADGPAAKEIIAKARSLLPIQVDRDSAAFPQSFGAGKLIAWQVRRIAKFIEEHLNEPIRLDALGKVVGLSRSHFARRFKLSFGEPPHAYLIRRRVEHACHLLLVSDLALAEIARASGFADQAHFTRSFRQRTGRSPGLWRREQRDGQASASDDAGAQHSPA
jgi:AraC family transcriptional regulator